MPEIHKFNLESFGELRIFMDEQGEPWIVGKDIAMALEYNPASPMATLFASVPPQWKGVRPIYPQNMLCLTEPGFYFFVGRSDKPFARA
jgi:prophage antirepressor-like protein